MRLRFWVVAITAMLTAIPAIADNSYPSRTGGSYSGPRWYGYFYNNNLVSENADHTNMTMIGATVRDEPNGYQRGEQQGDATWLIENGLANAAQYGERAMVDVESIVFNVSSEDNPPHACYFNNPNAAAFFQSLVQTLINDGYLVPNHPELGTVSSFYVADEPNNNCLQDQLVNNNIYYPNSARVNAINAIRQNPDTTNFPLATIVSENSGNGGYDTVMAGLALFDWIGLDDYGVGVSNYVHEFENIELAVESNPNGSGTPQHFFMVPTVSTGLGSGGVYTDVAPIQAIFNNTDNYPPNDYVIGIMPFKWNSGTEGMNSTSSWATGYIALGKSIVAAGNQPPPPPPSQQTTIAVLVVIVSTLL